MPLGWCCWRWLAASNPGVSVRHMAASLRCREVKFNGHFAIEVGNRSMIHGCLVAVALALRTAGGQGFCLDGVFDVRIIQLVSVIWNFTFHCTVSVYDLADALWPDILYLIVDRSPWVLCRSGLQEGHGWRTASQLASCKGLPIHRYF